MLQGITYFRVHDFLEQMEVLYALPALLQAQPAVRHECVTEWARESKRGPRALVVRTATDGLDWIVTLQIKLLVLDTVAFHFRHGFEDFAQRTRALDALATVLQRIATEFSIAVRRVSGSVCRPEAVKVSCSLLRWVCMSIDWYACA